MGPKSVDFFAFSTSNIIYGRFWTVITALFIHGDLIHLLGNIIFLYVFGNTLESFIGTKRMLVTFFIGGIFTFLISTLFYPPNIPMIGASAAIFTLAAVSMLVKPLKTSVLFLFLPVGLVAILYFIFNLFQVYYGIFSNIAYISHVIGFLIGIPIGIYWSRDWIKNLIITFLLLLIYLILAYWLIPILFIALNLE
jgi:membrane associated rhomboid family serine protease